MRNDFLFPCWRLAGDLFYGIKPIVPPVEVDGTY